MAEKYIFVAEKMLADEDYKKIVSKEDAEYFDGLQVHFDHRGQGLINHPDSKARLFPVKEKHCVTQTSLF